MLVLRDLFGGRVEEDDLAHIGRKDLFVASRERTQMHAADGALGIAAELKVDEASGIRERYLFAAHVLKRPGFDAGDHGIQSIVRNVYDDDRARMDTMPRPAEPRPRIAPKVSTIACPIQASLGVLGRKWAFVVLRDVAFFDGVRFSDILRLEPEMTPRVLSARLKDLTREGFVSRRDADGGREVGYDLTRKGRDTVPILAALMDFAFRHHAADVFSDGRPRTLRQVMPGAQAQLLCGLLDYATKPS